MAVEKTSEKKGLTTTQQTSNTSETPSLSTAAGSTMVTKGTMNGGTKIQKGIVKTVEDYEEPKSMTLPIFSN